VQQFIKAQSGKKIGNMHALGQMLCPKILFFCLLLPLLAACNDGTTGASVLSVQQTPKSRLIYVAIGASDTFGLGADDPQSESWPADLASMLGSDTRLVNLGIPGVTAANALQVELPVALDAHPTLVTIWLAVNDLADHVPIADYTRDLDQLLSRFQAADPQVRIAVANVPDLTYVPHFQTWDQQMLQAQIAAYNTAIASIVQRHHVLLVNLHQDWKELADHPEYISDDGFHPSTLGYQRIAEIFYSVLQQHSAIRN
jgi:lysophospholipase L1-like esterase